MLKLHGVPFSAHTRKVIVAARYKRLPLQLVRVIPIDPPPEWLRMSPLGKIPVLVHEGLTLPDSSVICAYLERIRPEPPLYPADPAAYARVLWLEEYVDGSLAEDVLRGVLFQRKLRPVILGQPCDEALVERMITEVIPPKLAYLQEAIAGELAVGDALSIADVTISSILTNYQYAGGSLEGTPRLAAWYRDIVRHEAIRGALVEEAGPAREMGFEQGFLRALGI
jgi:glutathione S-transferase